MRDALPTPPATGRVYSWATRVGLADMAPDGRARLDALARLLQDVAFADVRDVGMADEGAWVVRRCRIAVERFPGFDEELSFKTWCAGTGAAWAERATSLRGDRGARVNTLALWVHLDPVTGHPLALRPEVHEIYGEAAGGRKVRPRLRHPRPPAETAARGWFFRAADLDLAGHVNNANYWQVLEEELLGVPVAPPLDVEVEYRDAAPAGPARVLVDGGRRWVTGEDGTLFASLVLLAGGGAAPPTEA